MKVTDVLFKQLECNLYIHLYVMKILFLIKIHECMTSNVYFNVYSNGECILYKQKNFIKKYHL